MKETTIEMLAVKVPHIVLVGQEGYLSWSAAPYTIDVLRALESAYRQKQTVVLAVPSEGSAVYTIGPVVLLEDMSPAEITMGSTVKFAFKVIGRCRIMTTRRVGAVLSAQVVLLPVPEISEADWQSDDLRQYREEILNLLQEITEQCAALPSQELDRLALSDYQISQRVQAIKELALRAQITRVRLEAAPDLPYAEYYQMLFVTWAKFIDNETAVLILEADTVVDQMFGICAMMVSVLAALGKAESELSEILSDATSAKPPPSGKGGGELVPYQEDTKTPKKFLDVILDQLNDLARRLDVVIKAGSDPEGGAK